MTSAYIMGYTATINALGGAAEPKHDLELRRNDSEGAASSIMNSEIQNPYTPTCAPVIDCRDAAWYLSRVRKYYVWMGYGLLSHFAVGVTAGSIGAIANGPIHAAAPLIVGLVLWGPLLAWLVANLLRIGHISDEEFPAHYTKARWVGILVGAIFFPLLSIPAFISVRRLSLYRRIILKH